MRLVSIEVDRGVGAESGARENEREKESENVCVLAHRLPPACLCSFKFRTTHLIHYSPSLVILSLTPSWLTAACPDEPAGRC